MIYNNGVNGETAVVNPTIQQIQQEVKETLESVMGDSSAEILNEMSVIFMEDAIPLIQLMKDGLSKLDFQSISVAAHTLKGSSATIGLNWFASLCLEVETSSKKQETEAIGPQIEAVLSGYNQVETALNGFML